MSVSFCVPCGEHNSLDCHLAFLQASRFTSRDWLVWEPVDVFVCFPFYIPYFQVLSETCPRTVQMLIERIKTIG